MKVSTIYNVLAAAHLTYAVEGVPAAFQQRGGIMLVAPPQQMKSTFINALAEYGNALILSDLNVKTFVTAARREIANGTKRTIAFTAFEKLYKRDQETASNLEGCLSAIMEEGFTRASWEDSSMFCRTTRALVLGALVEESYRSHYKYWLESGFARRFLWVHFVLLDQEAISKSIVDWNPIQISNGDPLPVLPLSGRIPFDVDRKERAALSSIIRSTGQPSIATGHVLLCKILAVLKWHFRSIKRNNPEALARDTVKDFAEGLHLASGGARVEL